MTPQAREKLATREGCRAHATPLVQSVSSALQVLESFDMAQPELGVAELAARLNMSRSSVHRLLGTLVHHGFVEHNPTTRRYRLGLRTFEVGSRLPHRLGLGLQIEPAMRRLGQACSETVNVAVLDGWDIVYVNVLASQDVMQPCYEVGQRGPAHCTALGKVLLAGLSEAMLDERLRMGGTFPRSMRMTGVNPGRLRNELAQVRNQGYALDDEESAQGIRCLAVPLHNHTGCVVAGLSISAPAAQLTLEALQGFLPAVQVAAQELSQVLGYSPRVAMQSTPQ